SKMSLRELARMSQVSNAYLSQIERGLHEPSLRVLAAIAEALSLPLEELMAQARPDSRPTDAPTRRTDAVEAAIRAESRLTQAQKEALLAVYRSYLAESEGSQQPGDEPGRAGARDARSVTGVPGCNMSRRITPRGPSVRSRLLAGRWPTR